MSTPFDSDDDPFNDGPDDSDPFDSPAEIPSEFPKFDDHLRGRLLLIKPTKLEQGLVSTTLPKNSDGTPVVQDRITADVYVLDGAPLADFAGATAFPGLYISQSRVVVQLSNVAQLGAKTRQTMVLGRLNTRYAQGKPNPTAKERKAGPGNPWGLEDPTDADKATARAYLKANGIA
jgi:hypothetical protein